MWQPLNGRGARSADVGSKAASLDRLVAAGVVVPPAAGLFVTAYRTYVEAAGLGDFLAGLPVRVQPTQMADDVRRVEQAFLEAPLPAAVRDAINDAYQFVGGDGAVAVRSSATAEDLANASFAGQYRSVLGVDETELEHAVRLCWASLWAPGARAYRDVLGVSTPDLAMGLVIQRMVWAEWSGVAFTADPADESGEYARVEVVEGLGEGLVSGAVTPAVFRVRRSSLEVIPPPGPEFIVDVARMALAVEAAFGSPQDLEWSIAGGELHALQARPITTAASPGDEFDTPPVAGSTFTPAGVAEMLPGVLSPLIWTINGPLLEDAFTTLAHRLGLGGTPADEPWVARHRGRAALNLSLLKSTACRMPGGSDAEVERQYLGRQITADAVQRLRLRDRLGRMGPGLRAVRVRKALRQEADVFLEAAGLALSLQPDYCGVSSDALVTYRHRVRELARFGTRTEVAVAAAAAAAYRALELALTRWMDSEEAQRLSQQLTAGGIAQAASGCATLLLLWDLQCESCQLPEVAAAVSAGPLEGVEERLSRTVAGRELLHTVEAGLQRRGSAAVYGGPTWDEDRQGFWLALRHCVGLAPPEAPPTRMETAATDSRQLLESLSDRLCQTWRWRLTRTLTGQVVDIRRRLLARVVEDAREFLRLRETVKAALLGVGGEERRVVRELARRLLAAGLLSAEDDVLLLADDELDRLALTGRGPHRSAILRRRATLDAARAGPPLPEVFSGTPSLEPTSDNRAEQPGVVAGWAASPGRAMGAALVVSDLADAANLRPGEVLVGRSTDASWTPLFLLAGAIVMEEGGPLSHAAIVARELGLPAVLNARGATRRIRTGMLVSVDGSRGMIEILDPAQQRQAA